MRIVSGKERQEISRFFTETQDTARASFERDGVCVPVAIFMRDEGNIVFPLHHLINHKDVAAMVLNGMIERIRPLAFVFVTEAWLAKMNADATTSAVDAVARKYQNSLTEDAPDGGRTPKKGVKEAVMLQCCGVTGENFMLTAEIVRTGARPCLKPWEKLDNQGAVGRFVFDVTPLAERQ